MSLVDPDSAVETQEDAMVYTYELRVFPTTVETVSVCFFQLQFFEDLFLQRQVLIAINTHKWLGQRQNTLDKWMLCLPDAPSSMEKFYFQSFHNTQFKFRRNAKFFVFQDLMTRSEAVAEQKQAFSNMGCQINHCWEDLLGGFISTFHLDCTS